MNADAINCHVPPGVMVVVVVVFIASGIVNNMGIPFDLLDARGEKNIAPQSLSGGRLKW